MTSLTVGICAYNEEWNIGGLLENILTAQGLPADSEVIIVCSGQADDTAEIVSKFSERDFRVLLIQEPTRRGKAAAVNAILSTAKGEIIIFISADVIPEKGCFTGLIRAVEDGRVGIACGEPIPLERGGLFLKKVVNTLWTLHNHQLKRLSDAGTLIHASDVFCLRNGIINRIPEDIVNDDSYLAAKIKALGYEVRFVPGARVRIFGAQTVADYFLQRRRIIVGHYQVHKITGRFSYLPLSYSFLTKPGSTLKMLVEYLASRRGSVGIILTAPLEAAANLLALADIIRGRSYVRWPIVQSTKSLHHTDPRAPSKERTWPAVTPY
jgi:cellulose synthase/poly-beta-1,6-N-acetylglucosamine synthase-like glycosyltransferase